MGTMTNFKVRVIRYASDSSGFKGWFGCYVSKVYAIDNGLFLVWDEGDFQTAPGFEWVNPKEFIPSHEDENELIPAVELVDDAEEDGEA